VKPEHAMPAEGAVGRLAAQLIHVESFQEDQVPTDQAREFSGG